MTEKEFWARMTHPEIGCWEWAGPRNKQGYGIVSFNGRKSAHRLAWELSKGPIPEGMCVCHRCDVPWCCNPAHLFLATSAENIRDASDKGRMGRPRKLTDEQAATIRSNYAEFGVTQGGLARLYGVSESLINIIVTGRRTTYRFIDPPEPASITNREETK